MVKNYDILLSIYYNDYNIITDKKKRMDKKYDSKSLFIKGQRFNKSKKEDKEKSKLQPDK